MPGFLLDTNIYGKLAVDPRRVAIRNGLAISKVIIYGSSVVRKELRATPKRVVDGINLRLDLLRLYEELTRDRELRTTKKEQEVADSYFSTYAKLGGITSLHKLENDFLIVASASLHGLPIIVSEDNATMLNELALRSYAIVNAVLKLRSPSFLGYEAFTQPFKTSSSG